MLIFCFLLQVWSSSSFTPTSRTFSEADNEAFQQNSGKSAVSAGNIGVESVHSQSYTNMFEQFAHSSLAIEPDEEDEDEGDTMWDGLQAAEGKLSPALKYQRRSAKWRLSNNSDRLAYCTLVDEIVLALIASHLDSADHSRRQAAPMQYHTSQMMITV